MKPVPDVLSLPSLGQRSRLQTFNRGAKPALSGIEGFKSLKSSRIGHTLAETV
jgi:hypothetical protein